jgi:phosphoglycolate phosphatase-like HAD superfamily hydrolase
MALRAIIFDVDGTLANTERDGHRPAFNAAFAEVGLSWHWDEAFYGTLLDVAGGLERIRHYASDISIPPRRRGRISKNSCSASTTSRRETTSDCWPPARSPCAPTSAS